MKVTIRIQNFKSLEDVTIDLKTIMLLFGPNGAGKSSLLKSLSFLYENLFNVRLFEKTKYILSDSVDLGDYSTVVYKNDISRIISFTINIYSERTEYLNSFWIEKADEETDWNGYEDSPKKYKEIKCDESNTPYEHEYKVNPRLYYPYQPLNFSLRISFAHQKDGYNFKEMLINNNLDNSYYKICLKNQIDWNEFKKIVEEIVYHDSEYRIGNKIFTLNDDQYEQENVYSHILRYYDTEICLQLKNGLERLDLHGLYLHNETPFSLLRPLDSYTCFKVSRDTFSNDVDLMGIFANLYGTATGANIKPIRISYNKYYYYNLPDEIIEKFFDKYCKQLDYYFNYLPTILDQNLCFVDLGALRNIPSTKYSHHNKNTNDIYYGIPWLLKRSQNKIIYILQKYKNLYSLVVESDHTINYSELLTVLNNHSLEDDDENILKRQYAYILNKLLIDSKLAKSIYYLQNETDYSLFVRGNNNEIYNISESCSGLLQILPLLSIIAINGIHEATKRNETIYGSCRDVEFEVDTKSNIFIQQPELHLHPRLQSEFVSLLAHSKGIRTVLETHSEHIVRKLQLLIAENESDEDNSIVYYFDNVSGSTIIKQMKLNEYGQFLEPWPNDFFDETINVTLQLLETISRKQI